MHEADDGRHTVSSDHEVIGQITGDLDSISVETDLFLRLTQGSAERIAVDGLDAPPWETNLPGMMFELRRADRQKHAQIVTSIDERYQHRRGGRVFREKLAEPSLARL